MNEQISFRCLKSIGFCLIVFWLVFFTILFLSLVIAYFDTDWAMVGWIVPMFVLMIMGYFLAFSIAYMLLIRHKEKKQNKQNITIGLFEKTEKFLQKTRIKKLSIFTFWFTTILFALAVWVWILIAIFFVACFVFDFVRQKRTKLID